MTIGTENHRNPAGRVDASRPSRLLAPKLAAGGSVLAAVAASSCCMLPLALFGLGISGAWIGSLTRLAPYQPYFLAVAAVSLGTGYWRVWRSRRAACAVDGACDSPLPSPTVTASLVLATILVVAALAVDFVLPLFLPS